MTNLREVVSVEHSYSPAFSCWGEKPVCLHDTHLRYEENQKRIGRSLCTSKGIYILKYVYKDAP